MTRLIVSAVCALALLAGGPAAADTPAQRKARLLFSEGNGLVRAGDYATALERYREAYQLMPSPKILLNIGTALQLIGRHAAAADTFARYLGDAGADPARRGEVEDVLADLDTVVGHLRIAVFEPGVAVLVDGVEVGGASAADGPSATLAVRVEPGAHGLVAQQLGRAPVVATVEVAAGETKTVELRFPAAESAPALLRPDWPPAAAPAVGPVREPRPDRAPPLAGAAPPPGRGLRAGGLVASGAGAVLLAAGAWFAWSSHVTEQEVERLGGGGAPWTAELEELDQRGARQARMAAVALGGGVAALAGGATLYYLGRRRERAAAQLRPVIGPGFAGAALELRH